MPKSQLKLEPSDFVEIYKSILEEEHFYVDLFEKRLGFWTGLITAIITAIGWLFVSYPSSHVLFIVSGLGLLLIAFCGRHAAWNAADRVTRNLTERAKIEQVLGLTKPIKGGNTQDYWQDEPIVATEHIESRNKHKRSIDFHKANMGKRDNFLGRTVFFYNFALLLGAILFLFNLALVLCSLL